MSKGLITYRAQLFGKKALSQVAPEFSDLVTKTSILVAKNLWPFGLFIYHLEKDAGMLM